MIDLDLLEYYEIPYKDLSIEQLKHLINGNDYFKATKALFEVQLRYKVEAIEISTAIFQEKRGDNQLQAQALRILLNLNFDVIIPIITKKLNNFDSINLSCLIEFILENKKLFIKRQTLLIKLWHLTERNKEDFKDKDLLDEFFKAYASLDLKS